LDWFAVEIDAYLRLVLQNFDFANPGAFYGAVGERSLGSGLIYADVVFPLFNEETSVFDTVQGLAYVVTHECDADQNNVRHFNDLVVICPLIPLRALIRKYEPVFGEEQLKSLLVSAAKNEVFRVFFLPPAPDLLARSARCRSGNRRAGPAEHERAARRRSGSRGTAHRTAGARRSARGRKPSRRAHRHRLEGHARGAPRGFRWAAVLARGHHVSIVEIRERGDDARTQRRLDDVAHYLTRHRIAANPRVLTQTGHDVAAALIRLSQKDGADLIVAGAYGQSRLGEWVFGGATHGLLAASPLCCLFAH
jgi:nucleotide-binding universal stress UspA family protein